MLLMLIMDGFCINISWLPCLFGAISSLQSTYVCALMVPYHRYLKEVDSLRRIHLARVLVEGTNKAGGLGQTCGLTRQTGCNENEILILFNEMSIIL